MGSGFRLPGPQKFVEQLPFGLFFRRFRGYHFTYFWGPGSRMYLVRLEDHRACFWECQVLKCFRDLGYVSGYSPKSRDPLKMISIRTKREIALKAHSEA